MPPCPLCTYIVSVSTGQPAAQPPQQAVTEANPYRWVILFLLWLLYASFGVTAATIAPLVDPIIKDLNMSYSQMGLVLGAWQFVYIFTAAPLGAVVDRLGVRRSLGIGIIIVWMSLVLRGLAPDFYTLLFAVALFGVGGPIISIGAPKVVSLWFHGKPAQPSRRHLYHRAAQRHGHSTWPPPPEWSCPLREAGGAYL